MSRVPPIPVQVWVDGSWVSGTVRTCEVSLDGSTCSAVVSYSGPNCHTTGRFTASQMRNPSTGEPGCPAVHQDMSCCR